jgi:hypothetical protein
MGIAQGVNGMQSELQVVVFSHDVHVDVCVYIHMYYLLLALLVPHEACQRGL